jgi:hypothetical protein
LEENQADGGLWRRLLDQVLSTRQETELLSQLGARSAARMIAIPAYQWQIAAYSNDQPDKSKRYATTSSITYNTIWLVQEVRHSRANNLNRSLVTSDPVEVCIKLCMTKNCACRTRRVPRSLRSLTSWTHTLLSINFRSATSVSRGKALENPCEAVYFKAYFESSTSSPTIS